MGLRSWQLTVVHDSAVRYGQCFEIPSLKGARIPRVVEVFAARCSPLNSDAEGLSTCTLFLHGVLALNDTVGESSYSARAQQFEIGLNAETKSSGVWSAMGTALRERLIQHAPVAEHELFKQALRNTLAAGAWEATELQRWPCSFAQYEHLRQRTIGVQPFLELWKLIGGLSREEQFTIDAPLTSIEALSGQLQYLANDLQSLARDTERGQCNAISILSKERKMSLDNSRAEIVKLIKSREGAMNQAIVSLRELKGPPKALDWYLSAIEHCVAGNLLAMRDLASRYDNWENSGELSCDK